MYVLYDPRQPEAYRYVGLTTQPVSRRLRGHVLDAIANRNNWHNANWIRSLLADNVEPAVFVAAQGEWTYDEMCALEIEWIARLRREGYALTNMTRGGESTLGLPADRRPHGARNGMNTHPGLLARERNGRSRLSEELAVEIIEAHGRGATIKELALRYSVSTPLIGLVLRGQSCWTPLIAPAPPTVAPIMTLSDDDRAAIRRDYVPYRVSMPMLAERYGVPCSTIQRVLGRRRNQRQGCSGA